MSDIVLLRRSPLDLDSDLGRAFVTDACRAGEGLVSDTELQDKYEISDTDFRRLSKDRKVGRAIRTESELRVRNGLAAKEAAAKHFVGAPAVLNRIMTAEASNPRHAIDAARELRAVATGGNGDHPNTAEGRFTINITIGGDTERYEFDRPTKPLVDLERNDNGDQWD